MFQPLPDGWEHLGDPTEDGKPLDQLRRADLDSRTGLEEGFETLNARTEFLQALNVLGDESEHELETGRG
jgi:hypothetical protein